MKALMLGNAAVARGAYEAGVTVVSSYPGTPSTEITENIAKRQSITNIYETKTYSSPLSINSRLNALIINRILNMPECC